MTKYFGNLIVRAGLTYLVGFLVLFLVFCFEHRDYGFLGNQGDHANMVYAQSAFGLTLAFYAGAQLVFGAVAEVMRLGFKQINLMWQGLSYPDVQPTPVRLRVGMAFVLVPLLFMAPKAMSPVDLTALTGGLAFTFFTTMFFMALSNAFQTRAAEVVA